MSVSTTSNDEIYLNAFEKADLAKLIQAELDNYDYSLKPLRDNKAVLDYAMQTAFNKGKTDVARKLKLKGFTNRDIADLTGLSEDQIAKL